MVLFQQQWIVLTSFIMPLGQKLWTHGEIQLQLPLVFFGHKRTNFSLTYFIEKQISRANWIPNQKEFQGGKNLSNVFNEAYKFNIYTDSNIMWAYRCSKKGGVSSLFFFDADLAAYLS